MDNAICIIIFIKTLLVENIILFLSIRVSYANNKLNEINVDASINKINVPVEIKLINFQRNVRYSN